MNIIRRLLTSTLHCRSTDAGFCEEALREALALRGFPSIFTSDQGSWRDTIHIERLWRTVKYEDIHLQGYKDLRSLKKGVSAYFRFYNQDRFHQSLDYETPNMLYESFQYDYSATS